MDDQLIIVSADSHAGMPKQLWPEYLDRRYHDLLPRLHEDNTIYPTAIYLLGAKAGMSGLEEHREAHRTGWHGLHDPVLRMADMDREGISAELIFHGDFRLGDLFHNGTNRKYPLDVWHAGAQAWNRWAADAFGFAMDRFLVTAAIGPCLDMDAAIAEIEWIKDRKFTATFGPGYLRYPGMPPLFDAYWEPFWSACEERGIAIVVHAGFGTEQGAVFPQLERIYNAAAEAAGSTKFEALMAHADAVHDDSLVFFRNFLNHNVDSRRPMWQMMFGGVFDRHPNLKLLLTEIRADWIPATLRHLDAIYDERRADLPAKRKASEYWRTNCLAGASFIHKAEVGMRHEIGIETILFGRDYPHPESTWPRTKLWLQDAFHKVPEDELRLMLGENAIRFLDLDRKRLLEVARRIGPTVEDISATDPDIRPELMQSFAQRGRYLDPPEDDKLIPLIDPLVRHDLAAVGV